MLDFEKLGAFYIGKRVDEATGIRSRTTWSFTTRGT